MIERVALCMIGLLCLFGCARGAAPVVSVALPEPDSAGAKLEKALCSQCHGAPQPSAHVAKEWPNVLTRMNDHRVMLAMKAISDEERAVILDYLQKHAGQS